MSVGPAIAWVRSLPRRAVEVLSYRFLAVCIVAGRRLTARRLAAGRPRTMWGITPIVTIPLKVRCDKALGFRSESVVFETYYITRNFDWNMRQLARAFNAWPSASRSGYRLLLGVALLRYDVFHTFADRGVMPPMWRSFGADPEELAALKAAGKRLYVFAYGADVRTRAATLALGRWNFCVDCDDPGRYCVCDDARGTAIMATLASQATALVSLGDMLTYVPSAKHIAYWPIDTVQLSSVGVRPQTGALKIAHAPNHTHFKGTSYLEASIERLRARGFSIELLRISGVPNAEVLRLFGEADLVADQFIGGAYGYTALEALARAKPVMTYVRSADLAVAANECPFLNVTPDTLDEVLAWCCTHRDDLAAIGQQGRVYVERHHSIAAVAARFAALYIDTAGFPAPINNQLAQFIAEEQKRSAAIAGSSGWQHPWQITKSISEV